MNSNNKGFTCDQVKQMDMVDYLASLGHHPSMIRNSDYWYLSPLRTEKTASFKVNRKLNCWYDHGTGKGGNLVDFGILYHNCGVKELLQKFDNNFSFRQPPQISIASEEDRPESHIKIIGERSIISLSLIRYLNQRRISLNVAKRYCREVSFELNNKAYTAIGFKNNEGGYELRNQWFKGSSSPKAITIINNDVKDLSVFEGFFNFLSYQTINEYNDLKESNFLILNSTSFFEKSRSIMERHDNIRLFLDNDKTGQNCTQQALEWSNRYRDESKLYEGYNDMNEWMQEFGKKQRQSVRQNI